MLHISKGMRSVLRKCTENSQAKCILTSTPGIPTIQVAFMRHMAGEKYPYVPPFPYWKRRLSHVENWFDNTIHRFGEQSKIITIEGSIGIGKHEFAKRLAKEFDLLYVPGLQAEDLHVKYENGFNMRDLNEAMADIDNKLQDFKDLYTEDINKARIMRTQFECLRQRIMIYTNLCMLHLFSTGQGVVTVRSPYTEAVFNQAMADMGWINPRYTKWHSQRRNEVMINAPMPHLHIYLDTPVEVVKQNIAKRLEQDPNYQVGPHINDKYLTAIDKYYKQWLNQQRQHCEVFEIDWTEPADETELDYIWEAIASLPLEPEDAESLRYRQWLGITEDQCWKIRNDCQRPARLMRDLESRLPIDVPEFQLHHESRDEREEVYMQHPMARYNRNDMTDGAAKLYLGFDVSPVWK